MQSGCWCEVSAGRLLALVCLCALLIASLVAPIHKHASSQEGTCLICHVSERASLVAIDSDVGKPYRGASGQVTPGPSIPPSLDSPNTARTPRAPPSTLLSL